MRKISRTTENRLIMGTFTGLLLLCAGLWLAIHLAPQPEAVIENRREALYDAALVPPVPAGGSMNINTADTQTLATLPGIGESLAARIVAYREENGDFLHPAAIMEVSGIGEKIYAAIMDKICVK